MSCYPGLHPLQVIPTSRPLQNKLRLFFKSWKRKCAKVQICVVSTSTLRER